MSEVLITAPAVLELIDVSLDIALTISEFHQNRRLQREGNSTLHQGDQVGLPLHMNTLRTSLIRASKTPTTHQTPVCRPLSSLGAI
ncbi:hypothetical protein EYR41_011722 [Orbilia oligospora]|uniref:Uncharacterized protein n=1 Tax=Orbilia oligospora TaxID=2813651 RepID=A0A7C8PKA1_ORBOL|nr:hypothetical protein TWF751_006806 [Orbilia oligospora]TGJ63832.1 hypothetical protein EYR41_011722 [Orbilia oligospora]